MQRVSSVCISNHLSVTAFEQRIFDPCAETLSHSQNVNQAVSGACMTSKDNVLLIPEVQYCVFPCIQGLAWSVRAFSILRQLERGRESAVCSAEADWQLSAVLHVHRAEALHTELHGHYSKWSQATLNKLVKWGLREGLQVELSPSRVFHCSSLRFSLSHFTSLSPSSLSFSLPVMFPL